MGESERSLVHMKVICPYCEYDAEFVDTAEIYNGRSYGMAYLCKPCWAYVGVHKGTDKPLGRLANKELRAWKIKAHAAFDPLWKKHGMRRGSAYKWLMNAMGIPKAECHIGMFDVDRCKQVIEVIEQR
jgi:hypothetical protein